MHIRVLLTLSLIRREGIATKVYQSKIKAIRHVKLSRFRHRKSLLGLRFLLKMRICKVILEDGYLR